jgi:hypothetical protein
MQRLLYYLLLLALAIFAVLPFVFIGAGTWMLCTQRYRIAFYEPVRATVLSKHTERTGTGVMSGGKHAITPVIEYRYETGGQVYTCDQVTPVREGRSGSWATNILKQYEIGKTYEAYCHPRHPTKAFLIADYSFLAGFFILLPTIIVLAVLGLLIAAEVFTRGSRSDETPVTGSDGWFEIPANATLANRRRAAYVTTLAWQIVGLVVLAHYFVLKAPPYTAASIVTVAVYELLGLIPLVWALHFRRVSKRLWDARVFVNAPSFCCGEMITARVEQPVRTAVQIAEMRIALVCKQRGERKDGKEAEPESDRYFETSVAHYEGHLAQPGEILRANATLAIPADGPPTTPDDEPECLRYRWAIIVATQLENGPKYRTEYPLAVRASPEVASSDRQAGAPGARSIPPWPHRNVRRVVSHRLRYSVGYSPWLLVH